MKVFKFGGASIKDADAIINVGNIITDHKDQQLLIVISALGKTTNALEDVVNHFFEKKRETAEKTIAEIEANHRKIIKELIKEPAKQLQNDLDKLFEELRNMPQNIGLENYNMFYDQVVCFGELLSTKIVSYYLKVIGLNAYWLDVRKVMKTDDAYREAKINWEATTKNVYDNVTRLMESNIVVTQGFIGSTSTNYTTTLGREGSDYTASIFTSILEAEELVIWKDVPGVLNANPTLFKDVVKLDSLPYEEAIEMTYYGAQVIHPKTIKPIQNKNIPLHVRSFIDKDQTGTIIHNKPLPADMPPIIVYKRSQIHILFATKDFSFMAEENIGFIYDTFTRLRIKPNIMQNAAITLHICIDNNEGKVAALLQALKGKFNFNTDKDVEVLTIRHYNDDIIKKLTSGKHIIITQQTMNTVQFVYK